MITISIDEVRGPTGYTLLKILKLQELKTRDMSKSVEVETVKKVRLNGGGFIAKVYNPESKTPGSTYITSITGINTLTLKENEYGLKFSCSCPKFKFWNERALNFHGLADIRYSNGDDPDIKNPNFENIPDGVQLCKHLVALIQYLRSR
jgi:hypothetical protein